MQKILIVILFSIGLSIGVHAQGFNCPRLSSEIDPDNPFPNEIEGFHFFKEGKLKGIVLGVSTREDIERIFGPPIVPTVIKNASIYDYDSDWKMFIVYLSREGSRRTYIYSRCGVEYKSTWVPKPEYIGKIQSIQIIPKKPISFNKIIEQPDLLKSFDMQKTQSSTYYIGRCSLTYNVDNEDSEKPTKRDLESIMYSANPIWERSWFDVGAPNEN
ncbi:MAG: hypothetical protein JSS81_08475 [Acidobacteria bacterium]|nr:hypothetical protein [Acidobacteriota bacterium]